MTSTPRSTQKDSTTNRSDRSSRIGVLSFGLFFLLLLVMGGATFVEHYYGTAVAQSNIYYTTWFIGLWGIACLLGLIVLFKMRRRKSGMMIGMHLSLVLILVGALVSFLSSHKGYLLLQKGEATQTYLSKDNGKQLDLPFKIRLTDCSIEYYPGSSSPQDFISQILIEGEHAQKMRISMNHIATYKGYRFYQNSFNNDLSGVKLLVNYDPWGIPITYTGYLLFCLTFLVWLFAPGSKFRQLWKQTSRYTLILVLPAAPLTSRAAPRSVPKEIAQALSSLQMEYNGRIAPVNTLATDFTHKLTGKTHYKELNADQFFWSWIFYFDDWKKEPALEVNNRTLEQRLGGASVSLASLFSYTNGYALTPFLKIQNLEKPTKVQSKAVALNEKVQLCMMLHGGKLLKLFPIKHLLSYEWLSPTDSLPSRITATDSLFIRGIFPLINEFIQSGKLSEVHVLTQKLRSYQRQKAGSILLPPQRVKAEQLYNGFAVPGILFKFNLTLGTIGFILFILSQTNLISARESYRRRFWRTLRILLYASTVLLICFVGLRTYIIQRLPLSNGYETMLAIALIAQLIGAVFARKLNVLAAFTFLISGFLLLVASLSFMDPQITPLMPVLGSPLLSLHVSVIMIAYAFLAFTFFCSLSVAIVRPVLHFRHEPTAAFEKKMQTISRLFLYPALWLLAAGIFLGAVWANVSWGNYWSWDPKEVWALITFLTYAIAIHSRTLPFFQKPTVYHFYLLFAAFTAAMTYWGVNYLLGGMHAYS